MVSLILYIVFIKHCQRIVVHSETTNKTKLNQLLRQLRTVIWNYACIFRARVYVGFLDTSAVYPWPPFPECVRARACVVGGGAVLDLQMHMVPSYFISRNKFTLRYIFSITHGIDAQSAILWCWLETFYWANMKQGTADRPLLTFGLSQYSTKRPTLDALCFYSFCSDIYLLIAGQSKLMLISMTTWNTKLFLFTQMFLFSVFGTVVKCLHLPFYLKHFECLPDHGHQCRRHHYHSSRSCQFVTVQCALFSYLLQHIATYAILVLTSSTSGVLTQHEEPRELTDCYQRFTSPHNNETYKFPSRADMHAHCLDQFMWKRDRIRWADFNITDKDFDFIRSLSITVGYNTYKPKAIFL